MPPVVRLLAHTPEPERTVALAARLCYSARGVAELGEHLGPDEARDLVRRLEAMGHLSAFEHAAFTFGVEGISRACSHQLVRHRLASYSQQSQRYVRMDRVQVVVPPSLEARPELRERFLKAVEDLWALYRDLADAGVPAEDARYVLPNACETKIVVSMNARELRHFFRLRLCRRAQWEIRALARAMLEAVVPVAPALFRRAGPGCLTGPCPEGEYSCGQAEAVRAELLPLVEAP